jgi:hypothetical protein
MDSQSKAESEVIISSLNSLGPLKRPMDREFKILESSMDNFRAKMRFLAEMSSKTHWIPDSGDNRPDFRDKIQD